MIRTLVSTLRFTQAIEWLDRKSNGQAFRIGIALALAAAILPIALGRLIDGDEGFYLVAARLVAEGKRPYTDFFFPQMPVLPYLFGGWFAAFGPSWYGGRFLAGLLAVGTGVLIAEQVRRSTGQRRWAALAACLYLFSGFVMGWFTAAKTFGLSALFLVAGTVVLQSRHRRASLWAGALFALAMNVRLYLAAIFVCAVIFLVRRDRWSRTLVRELTLLAAGAVVGLLPALPALLSNPEAFYFGAVRFHGIREFGQMSLFATWYEMRETLLSVLALEVRDGTGSVQFLGILVLAFASGICPWTRKNSLAAYAWMALFIASLLPSPSHTQYFCLLVPFLIIEATTLVATIRLSLTWPIIVTGTLAYAALGAFDVHRFVASGADVPGVLSADRIVRWSIPTVEKVSAVIDSQGVSVGASWWPGYFVSSRTTILPALANDFGFRAAPRLDAASRARLHLVTHEEVKQMILERSPRLFVEGNWAARPAADALPRSGFTLVDTVENARIWVFNPR